MTDYEYYESNLHRVNPNDYYGITVKMRDGKDRETMAFNLNKESAKALKKFLERYYGV